MKTIEELRSQFNDCWEKGNLGKAQTVLSDFLNIANQAASHELAISHLVYWSKYNDGFDQMLDVIFGEHRKELNDILQRTIQARKDVERELAQQKERLEILNLVAEIETLGREWEQMENAKIVQAQNQSDQAAARIRALEEELAASLGELSGEPL